ncbi:MAG: hypothetical protein IJU26_04150 [Synergistaceae bacterium]|nr:hypothetical protein [Synergistaceae bacterium]
MRRIKYFAPLVMFMVLCLAGKVFAYKINHYREEQGIRAEAAIRKVRLIPIAYAQTIAAARVGADRISFTDIALINTAGSSDFRPVFRMQCVTPSNGYNIDVDASTGTILTFGERF